MTFLKAMLVFKRDGQSLQNFNEELKKLTEKDRDDLKQYFAAEGVEITS